MKKKTPTKMRFVGLYVPQAMKRQVEMQAMIEDRPLAQIIRRAIAEYLERHNGMNELKR